MEGHGRACGFKAEWWTPRLTGPLLAATVVRVALLAAALARTGVSALVQPDTSSYLIPGRNLLLHGRFFADGVPDLLRTPGYRSYWPSPVWPVRSQAPWPMCCSRSSP